MFLRQIKQLFPRLEPNFKSFIQINPLEYFLNFTEWMKICIMPSSLKRLVLIYNWSNLLFLKE